MASRAVQISAHGGVESLSLINRPKPEAKAGEAIIRVDYAGINFIDTYQRAGIYPVPLPLVLGLEGSGVVENLDNVQGSGLAVGDRVAWTRITSSYADHISAPAGKLIKLPAEISLELGAAAFLQGLTALSLTTRAVTIKKGDFVLVHAAAGGTGRLLVQLATHLGAHVIGTTSTPEKAAIAKAAGAKDVILYHSEDVLEAVNKITVGKGVQVAFDGVGKDTFDLSLKSLDFNGTLISFGQSSGKVPPIDVLSLVKNIRLIRPSLFNYTNSDEEFQQLATDFLDLLAKKVVTISVQQVFALEEAGKAHALIESGGTFGKLLLKTQV
jgi:NADPH2:quinone reductase